MTSDLTPLLADFAARLEKLRQQARVNPPPPHRKPKYRRPVDGQRPSKARKPYYHPGHND